MKIAVIATASVAFAFLAATLSEAPPADAAEPKVVRKVQRAKPSTQLRHVKKHYAPKIHKKVITTTPLLKKRVTAPVLKKGVTTPLVKDGGPVVLKKSGPIVLKSTPLLKLGKADLGKLPMSKAIAGTATFRGRVALPKNVQPKFSLIKAPAPKFHHRMAPFVQRHWKKAFFWVAVAGIGYLTIPDLYYDRFVEYVSLDEPDYEGCIHLLSLAALEEEEEIIRVRRPMPTTAVYRYSATAAPEEAKEVKEASAPSCAFDPFIERNWSRPFVWVQIPKIGNVTVPEDYYDRFYGFVSADPANYPAACAVLVEAAAADTVATTSLELQRPEFR